MLRNILAVAAGLFVGGVVNMSLIVLNSTVLYPMAPGTDMNDAAAMAEWIRGLPTPAFFVVILAHLGQATVGAAVAARLSASAPMRQAILIGLLSLLGGVITYMDLPGPRWMAVEFPLYLVCAWLMGRIESRRRAAAA